MPCRSEADLPPCLAGVLREHQLAGEALAGRAVDDHSVAGRGEPEVGPVTVMGLLARKASVIMLLAGYVRNQATTEADIEAAVRTSGLDPSAWMSSYADLLRRLTDPQRFPALTEFIASGVFDAADEPDDEFIFGLDRILDGIEALIAAEPPGNR